MRYLRKESKEKINNIAKEYVSFQVSTLAEILFPFATNGEFNLALNSQQDLQLVPYFVKWQLVRVRRLPRFPINHFAK